MQSKVIINQTWMWGTNNQSKQTRETKLELTFETYKIQLPNERQPIRKSSLERNKQKDTNKPKNSRLSNNKWNQSHKSENTERVMISYDISDIT